MRLMPRNSFIAGTVLVLLVNALVLGGVGFNRGGEPESRLLLSERELSLPWGWLRHRENSGLSLKLEWRVIDAHPGEYYSGYGGGTPEWLDEAHMRALGFATAGVADGTEGRRRFERQERREVLLVLELAGAAWQRSLERVREGVARHEAAARVNADSKEFAERAKNARERLQEEQDSLSRLFAVDAGTDLAALRAKYPDRTRFLIIKATVRPRLDTRERKTVVTGYISELAVAQANVPHRLRPMLEPVVRAERRANRGAKPRFEAAYAVGRRLEPWIDEIRLLH